ncbi:MAG: hypothetical protein WDM96_08465 [Lacunisphaera sp.]
MCYLNMTPADSRSPAAVPALIVDSHVYCFTAPDTPAGHASAADHLAFWQRQYALHHQPAFRVRDRTPGDARRLLDPTAGDALQLAAGRNFRVDRTYNRLVWTIDGEDYTKQQLPPNVIEFSPGALIAEMDHAGVDLGLIHADATLTKDVAYLAACVAAHPDRLRAMAPLDEWLIPGKPDQAIAQAVAAIRQHRLHALKVIPAYAYQRTRSRSFTEPAWRPFWDEVVKLDVPGVTSRWARVPAPPTRARDSSMNSGDCANCSTITPPCKPSSPTAIPGVIFSRAENSTCRRACGLP